MRYSVCGMRNSTTIFLLSAAAHEFMTTDCALCRAQHEDYRLVYKDEHCFCIANIEPLNDGHFMVLPTRHVCELDAFEPMELKAIHDLLHRLSGAIKKEYG